MLCGLCKEIPYRLPFLCGTLASLRPDGKSRGLPESRGRGSRNKPVFRAGSRKQGGISAYGKKADEALAEAEEALRLDSTSVPGYLHKANALVVLGKATEAARFLENSAEKLPEEPRVLQARATVYLQAQEYEKALEAAERYVFLCADDDKAWSLKGAAHAYLGQKAEAGNSIPYGGKD
jgi:Flp pilus assembly protein TadD, contains TPR repeats